jgi:hypothetical protein
MNTNTNGERQRIRDWVPKRHLDRACELAEAVEDSYVNEVNPDTIALAHLHVEIARTKILERRRA